MTNAFAKETVVIEGQSGIRVPVILQVSPGHVWWEQIETPDMEIEEEFDGSRIYKDSTQLGDFTEILLLLNEFPLRGNWYGLACDIDGRPTEE